MIAWTTRRRPKPRRNRQSLRFTPYAWAKLVFLRDMGDTEVGGFGISVDGDPLLIEDFVLVNQICTSVSVEFDDTSVADHFDAMVDQGRKPDQFARIWIHTHPGSCPRPSGTDEETFERCFGACDWAVMFILARQGATYTRLRFNVGPNASKRLSSTVEYGSEFPGADHDRWLDEYADAVQVLDPFAHRGAMITDVHHDQQWPGWRDDPTEWSLHDRSTL